MKELKCIGNKVHCKRKLQDKTASLNLKRETAAGHEQRESNSLTLLGLNESEGRA